MACERPLHKRVKFLPTHLLGAGEETLDGIEHFQIAVEVPRECLGQGLRAQLELELLGLLFPGTGLHEYADRQHAGQPQRHRDREPPSVPHRPGFGRPDQHEGGLR
jgi:hypothetical protein